MLRIMLNKEKSNLIGDSVVTADTLENYDAS